MPVVITPNLALTLPEQNVSTGWGTTLNADFKKIDDIFAAAGTGTSVGMNVGTGKKLVIGGTLILGSGDGTASAAAAQGIRGANKTGTNVTGANLTIDAPNGTGTGGSGSIIFRTAPPSGSGNSANTMTTVMQIKNDGTVAINGSDISAIVPVGAVTPYAGTATPGGWLLCDGSAKSTTTYADLFAAIGYTYGGSGTSFNLPDLRGRAPFGKDNMGGTAANRITSALSGISGTTLGASGGLQDHLLVIGQIPAHRHYIASVGGGTAGALSTTNYVNKFYSAPVGNNSYDLYGTSVEASLGLTSDTGGGGAHNNMPPTLILNYIIKT